MDGSETSVQGSDGLQLQFEGAPDGAGTMACHGEVGSDQIDGTENPTPNEIHSRAELNGKLSQLVDAAAHQGAQGALLLVGVDGLTHINKTFGYDVGDSTISLVGERLGAALRDNDYLGRFSSSKFGVLLHDCDAQEAVAAALRMMSMVEREAHTTCSGAVAVTVSMGAVLLPDHAQTTQAALGCAKQSIEVARTDPNQRFYCFDPSSTREHQHARSSVRAEEIIRALNDRRIETALHPVVTSDSHDPEFCECRLKLRLTNGSILDADDFVPIAEDLGLSKLIDHRALELAVELLRISYVRKLSLKVSAQSTKGRHWIDALEALTGGDRALTERLTVEITESIAVADMEATTRFVKALKAAGCRVALDEMGAGYASFRSLRNLGFDIVKIQGKFIETLGSNEKDDTFVQTLLDLAHRFGVKAVDEWVGKKRSVDLLKKAGVNSVQGDFFGAPELYEEKSVPPGRLAG